MEIIGSSAPDGCYGWRIMLPLIISVQNDGIQEEKNINNIKPEMQSVLFSIKYIMFTFLCY